MVGRAHAAESMANLYQETAVARARGGAARRLMCAPTSPSWAAASPDSPPRCTSRGRGAAVVLLEAEELGFGASGRNGGQVNPGLKLDPDTVERDFGADLGGRMNVFAGAAPALVFELVKRYGIDCDARQNGTLRAAVHARHAGGDTQDLRAARAAGRAGRTA